MPSNIKLLKEIEKSSYIPHNVIRIVIGAIEELDERLTKLEEAHPKSEEKKE